MNAATLTPTDKIRMMKASLRCHNYGLAAFIPFLGPLLGIAAAIESGRARSYEKQFWNPARAQRLIGVGCAVFGTLLWTTVDLLIIWNIINSTFYK
jgi:hypothetical protein